MTTSTHAGPRIDTPVALRVGHAVAVWLAACAVIVGVRFRGDWPFYAGLHTQLRDAGLHPEIRRLDYAALMLGAAVLLAVIGKRLAHANTAASSLVLCRAPRPGWLRVSLLGSLPMVIGGAALMISRGSAAFDAAFWTSFAAGVVRAPFVEEVFYRGILVALPAALLAGGELNRLRGRIFWIVSGCSALVFGAGHIPWNVEGLANGWQNLLVTAIGALWFTWLMASWRSIVVPMILHAAMNFGWMLSGAAGAGGGGLAENLLRAGTITVATWLTIRARKHAQ